MRNDQQQIQHVQTYQPKVEMGQHPFISTIGDVMMNLLSRRGPPRGMGPFQMEQLQPQQEWSANSSTHNPTYDISPTFAPHVTYGGLSGTSKAKVRDDASTVHSGADPSATPASLLVNIALKLHSEESKYTSATPRCIFKTMGW